MSAKRLAAVTLCLVVVAFAVRPLAQATSVVDRFNGTWKEDVSRRKVSSALNLRFQRSDKGILQEARGPEVRPVFQTIVFDGKPHKLDDGNNSIAWTQVNATTFERVLSDAKGQPLTVRRIRISGDGKTLTEDTEQKLSDGRMSVDTFVYQRASGDAQELVGRWNAQSFKTTESIYDEI